MFSFWKETATAAQAADYGIARAVGEMPRELDADGRRQFMRYEARLTEFVADLPELLLSLYDLRLSGAEMLMDVLRTHPVVVVDGVLHDNPYYVPADTLLGLPMRPMTGRPPDQAGAPAREQLSALRSLLVLFMLLVQQDSESGILHFVANSVGSLSHCTTEGIFLDGQWRDVGPPDQDGRPASRPVIRSVSLSADISHSMQVELAGVTWSNAYSLGSPHGPSGYLVVGAEQAPAEGERFLLQVLAQQTGVALANVRLLTREREQAAELRAANLALARSMKVHQTLTRVALAGEGQDGIALAVYQLTGRAVAIEDRFGNLRAWAGPSPPARTRRPPPTSGTGSWTGSGRRAGRSGPVSACSQWPCWAGCRWGSWPCTTRTGPRMTRNAWPWSTPGPCWPWRSPGYRAWPRPTPTCAPTWFWT